MIGTIKPTFADPAMGRKSALWRGCRRKKSGELRGRRRKCGKWKNNNGASSIQKKKAAPGKFSVPKNNGGLILAGWNISGFGQIVCIFAQGEPRLDCYETQLKPFFAFDETIFRPLL